MNEQTARVLEAIAAKLGVGAEVLWAALLKQAAISSTIDVLVAVAVIIGWPLSLKFWKWCFRKCDEDRGEDEFAYAAAAIVSGLVLLVMTLGVLFTLDTVIAGFINPEYWALNHLANMFRAK